MTSKITAHDAPVVRLRRAWRCLVALAAPSLLVAGCGGGSTPGATPVPTTRTTVVMSGYTPAQVLGWVTPTLQNGASLVSGLAPSATDAEVSAGAKQLAVACGVSLGELAQTTWTGTAHRDEQALAATVTKIQALIADPPAGGLGSALRPAIAAMNTELGDLQRDLG